MRYHKVPWVEISGGLVASAVFLLNYFAVPVYLAALSGVLVLIGWRLTFGTDLTKAEAYASAKGIQSETAAQLMENAEIALHRLTDVSKTLTDPYMTNALKEIAKNGSAILEKLCQNPDKIVTSSRFLDVYLGGVAKASEEFLAVRKDHPEAEKEFMDLLKQAQETCANKQKAITADKAVNLSIEIDVLKRRMAAEPTKNGE